jgi:hypothetical protein
VLLVLSFRDEVETIIARQKNMLGFGAEHCNLIKIQCLAPTLRKMRLIVVDAFGLFFFNSK